MVSYSQTSDMLDTILIDDVCVNIYKDVCAINEHDINKSHNEYLKLFDKYSRHYLITYFCGVSWEKINNYNMAIKFYDMCIQKYPLIDAYLNMAIILHKFGHVEQTKYVLNNAVDKQLNDTRLFNFIGTLYYLEKDYYKAYEYLNKVLHSTHDKNLSIKSIYNNLGFTCSAIGKTERAISYFDSGLSLELNERTYDVIKCDVQLLQNKLINYDYMYSVSDNFNDYLLINHLFNTQNKFIHEHKKNEKIKIGLVSPDLRQHVVSSFLFAILKNFNKNHFEYFCFANVMKEDQTSQEFKKYTTWYNIFKCNTDDACKLILDNNIDILIDLAGHTNDNRLDIFAKKPAPIQVSYLGFPNTTGLTNMDYRITDIIADPIETQQKYTEKLIRLPCFLCFTPTLLDIPITCNETSNIIFGIFNKSHKYNKTTFMVWANILNKLPNSKLLVKRDIKAACDIRFKHLKSFGINDDRIIFIDHMDRQSDYYKMMNSVDVCLDTFPYSGTTTSCDCFMMGLPIITLNIPNRHVSNVTCSLLTNMGFPELIAYSLEEYVDIAINITKNKIIEYKKTIKHKFLTLMNPITFANNFDKLLSEISPK